MIIDAVNQSDGILTIKIDNTEDDDNDDFSGPALGGHISMRSDSDEDDDDDGGPPMMGNLYSLQKHISVPSKSPFRI